MYDIVQLLILLIFFLLHTQGLIDIAALWGSIGVTIAVFYPINRAAALLLVPHFAWVSFATILNFEIWRRNRGNKKQE